MPDYVTQTQLQSEIPETDLIDALDDDKDGVADESAWAQILETASRDCDAFLSARYTVPFADPLPAAVQSAAFVFAGEKIYKRRRTSDDQNPFFKRAEFWRERLGKIGDGDLNLEASAGEASQAAAWGSNTKISMRAE